MGHIPPENFPQLPTEIIAALCNLCDFPELSSLASTNSHYQSEAERLLYLAVTLDFDRDKNQTRKLRCLRSIVESPRRASTVRSFMYRFHKSFDMYVSDDVGEVLLSLLCDALVAMVSLDHLDVIIGPKLHLSTFVECLTR